MSVQVSYKKQVVFYFLYLIIILVIIEVVVQIWWYEVRTCGFEDSPIFEDLDPKLKREICIEHAEMEINRNTDQLLIDHGYAVQINSHGLRGAEFSKEKPPDTYRIIMVGGSTTFGVVVLESETIPSFLQQKFDNSKLDVKVEVINAGVNAASSNEEVELIKNKLLDYEPDLFIVYDGWNDLTLHPAYDWQNPTNVGEFALEGTNSNEFLNQLYLQTRVHISFYKTPLALMYFFSSIQSQEIFQTQAFVPDEDLENILVSWKDNWSEICELGKEVGFSTLVTVQPIPGTSDRTLTDFEYGASKFFIDKSILPVYDMFTSGLDDLNGKCTRTADLRNAFDGISEPIYFDMIHVAAKGNWIVSERIFEETLPIVLAETDSEFKQNDLILTKDESKIDWSGTDLSGLNLIGMDLSGLDLSHKDFSNTNFGFVNFTNTNLSHSNLTSAWISDAIIYNTDFSYSDLNMATLRLVDLTSANFEGADLIKTDFSDSELSHLNLSGFNLTSVSFVHANLEGVNFTNTDLSHSFLHVAHLTNSTLTNTDLSFANLTRADLTRANFDRTDLTSADLSHSNLYEAYIINSTFTNTDLSFANLTSADLSHSNLYEARLMNSILTNTDLY